MLTLLDPPLQKTFLKDVFAWYRKCGRHDMPWRKTRDPYSILVSEFMLQQTTVATVRPYYDRFLKRFPTLSHLAAGDLNDVLALWSGLGYYARARNLWAAARIINEKFRGRVPKDVPLLVKLPGVGAYIAGAVSTIAFNSPASVLDSNIIRVLMRLLAIDDDPQLKAVQVILRKISFELNCMAVRLQKKERQKNWRGARALSLALMDLGATICVSGDPKCFQCPVRRMCLAEKYEKQASIPRVAEKGERPTIRRLYAIISHQGQWLLGLRPKEGLFGGLWEFPGFDFPKGEEPVPFLETSVEKEVGIRSRVHQALPAFEHQLSHRIYVVRPYLFEPAGPKEKARLKRKGTQYDRFRWVSPPSIPRFGISSITKRIINELKAATFQQGL